MKRQVFFNCNFRGIIPISTAIYSLLRSADSSAPLAVFLAHDTKFAELGGCEAVKKIVDRFPFASIRFVNAEPFLQRYQEVVSSPNNAWTPMVWAWTFCADMLPDISGNLVFIDWDMLVLKDLKELYALDLESEGLVSAALSESAREHRPELVAAGWPEEAGCTITTALQVINLDAFRREKIREQMFAWFLQHKVAAVLVEQDAINVVAGARIKRLHPRYNCPVGWLERLLKDNFLKENWRVFKTKDVLEALVDPSIVHFIGGKKPWNANQRAWHREYAKAMAEIGYKVEGETVLSRVVGRAADLYHALLRRYAHLLLNFYR